MRCLNDEFKPFFVLLETCFVYGIQGDNNLSDKGPCIVGCNYNMLYYISDNNLDKGPCIVGCNYNLLYYICDNNLDKGPCIVGCNYNIHI